MKKTNRILSLALAISLLTGCTTGTNTKTGYSTLITMDVNPSIQLELDDNDKVIKALGNNAEAKTILEGMDLTNAQAKVAVNAVLGSLVKEGYLNVDNNTVLLSVENDNQQKRESLEKELSDEIHLALKDYQIDGAILANELQIDEGIQSLSDQYDISYGKATLIKQIISKNNENKTYKEEDLVKLDAQELVLINQEVNQDSSNMTGEVSQSGYLSKEEALVIALKDAGLTESQIKNLEIDYDMENGVLTYEIEFDYNGKEYDYEVSVEKGIIEKDVDFDDDQVKTTNTNNNKNNTTNKTTNTSKKYTKDQALALALKDAGLKESQIKNLRIELDDKTIYEIDFDYSNKEYSYDVHVTKGIVDKDIDVDNNKKTTTTTQKTTSTKKYSKDQALALALKDAGLNKSDVSRLKIELDDGTVYEIDFDYGDKEYSYDVHVNKGIIDKEIERRD